MMLRRTISCIAVALFLAGLFGGGVDHCGTPVNTPDTDGCCAADAGHQHDDQAPCHKGHLSSCCAPHSGIVPVVAVLMPVPSRTDAVAHPTGGIAIDPAIADFRPPILG